MKKAPVRRLVALPGQDAPARLQPETDEPALLTVAQFARKVGVGIDTVYAWRKQGIIHTIPVGLTGRVQKIPAGEVERLRSSQADSR
ncbi:MAG: helix-turn-helix domain-containing protein [Patescibacteria group bacterium]|nr:helix-turn-helix domain-containing protein [Patescibacteria group bacterium]